VQTFAIAEHLDVLEDRLAGLLPGCGMRSFLLFENGASNIAPRTANKLVGGQMPDYTMFEDFTIHGRWWLPGLDTADHIPGMVTYKAGDHITLELEGSFADESPFNPEHANPQMVLGFDEYGHPCTLLQLRVRRASYSIGCFRTTFEVANIVYGTHFTAPTGGMFDALTINYTHLEKWFDAHPFKNVRGENNLNCETAVGFKAPPTLSIPIPELDLTIIFETRLQQEHKPGFEILWRQRAIMTFKPNQPQPLAWYQNAFHHVQRFLTMLINEPIYFNQIWSEDCGKDMQGRRSSKVVSVYAVQSGQHCSALVVTGEMLFTLPQISDRIGLILNEWIKKGHAFATIYDLFFVTIFEPDLLPRFNFLANVQALESYHRIVYGGTYLTLEEYEPVRQIITAAIPSTLEDDFKQSLRKRIFHGKDFSLRKRIQKTLQTLNPETLDLITKRPKVFATRIVDTRNYLTHNDESTKEDVIPEDFLPQANRKIRVLLRVLLLREVGLTEEEIMRAIVRVPLLKYDLGRDVA
jgi:hypothetical protein